MNYVFRWIDTIVEYFFGKKDIANFMIKSFITISGALVVAQVTLSYDFGNHKIIYSTNPADYFSLILAVVFALLAFVIWIKNRKRKDFAISINHCNFKDIKDESLYKVKGFNNYDLNVKDIKYNVTSDKNNILKHIKKRIESISNLIREQNNINKILYCGMSPIPFSFYLGYLMRKSLEDTQVFEYNDSKGDWNKLKKGDCNSFKLTNDFKKLNNGTDSDIVLLVSVSFPISKDSIPNHLKKHPCVSISVEEPKRECIDSYEKIENIRKEFKETLDSIKTKYPKNKTVHLFLATPDSLTFVLGKTINENMHSNLYVYGFNQGVYDWYVNINNENIEFLNKNDDKV